MQRYSHMSTRHACINKDVTINMIPHSITVKTCKWTHKCLGQKMYIHLHLHTHFDTCEKRKHGGQSINTRMTRIPEEQTAQQMLCINSCTLKSARTSSCASAATAINNMWKLPLPHTRPPLEWQINLLTLCTTFTLPWINRACKRARTSMCTQTHANEGMQNTRCDSRDTCG